MEWARVVVESVTAWPDPVFGLLVRVVYLGVGVVVGLVVAPWVGPFRRSRARCRQTDAVLTAAIAEVSARHLARGAGAWTGRRIGEQKIGSW